MEEAPNLQDAFVGAEIINEADLLRATALLCRRRYSSNEEKPDEETEANAETHDPIIDHAPAPTNTSAVTN